MIVDTNVTPSVEFFKTLEDFKMLFLSPKVKVFTDLKPLFVEILKCITSSYNLV